MHHGIFVAPFADLAEPNALLEVAQAAEEYGWDGIFLWDHVLRDPEETELVGSATVSMAAIAAMTNRIRFGALVTPITRRRPQVFARETIALDRLSNGRLIVGLGLGVDRGGELSRFGEVLDPVLRGQRLDEGAEILLALWSGKTVDITGEHFSAEGVRFLPGPVQRPHPPLWFAARQGARRPILRAARIGDGVHAIEMDAEAIKKMAEVIASERGSLDGFDIVCPVEPGTAGDEWDGCGVTWAMHSFASTAPIAEILRVVTAGPPRS